MHREKFQLHENTLSVMEEVGQNMPGGFFIYKAAAPETLLYDNKAVFDIFGCGNLEEFKELTAISSAECCIPMIARRVKLFISRRISTR